MRKVDCGLTDEFGDGIEGSGVEKTAPRLNHVCVIAGMAGAALVAQKQVDVPFFGKIERMTVFAAQPFSTFRQSV